MQEQTTILRSALPEMVQVKSSNIYSIGYDVKSKMLYVLFSKDAPAVYRYPGIDPETHEFVMEAESIGKAFNDNIKKFSITDPALVHQKLELVGDGVSVEEGTP